SRRKAGRGRLQTSARTGNQTREDGAGREGYSGPNGLCRSCETASGVGSRIGREQTGPGRIAPGVARYPKAIGNATGTGPKGGSSKSRSPKGQAACRCILAQQGCRAARGQACLSRP